MNDRDIVNAIVKDGKVNLFSLIVKRYEGMVFSKAIGITKNGELAKDVCQQTFLRAYKQLDSWRGQALGPWLTAIACHQSLNMLEQERHHSMLSLDNKQIPDETYSDEHEERLLKMEAEVSLLPEADRNILRLFYHEHMKTSEIAKQTGLSASNVLVKLHRIRTQLKKKLQS